MKKSGKKTYIYVCNQITLLYTWNWHNLVKHLCFTHTHTHTQKRTFIHLTPRLNALSETYCDLCDILRHLHLDFHMYLSNLISLLHPLLGPTPASIPAYSTLLVVSCRSWPLLKMLPLLGSLLVLLQHVIWIQTFWLQVRGCLCISSADVPS